MRPSACVPALLLMACLPTVACLRPLLPTTSLISSTRLQQLTDSLQDRENAQAAFAKSISDAVARTRQSIFDANPLRPLLAEIPSTCACAHSLGIRARQTRNSLAWLRLPEGSSRLTQPSRVRISRRTHATTRSPREYFLNDDVSKWRDTLRMILQEERVLAALLLGSGVLFAIVGGLTVGDRSGRTERKPLRGDEPPLRKSLTPSAAAAFDAGRPPDVVERLQTLPPDARQSDRQPGVGAALWLELVLCVLLDAAGDASFFYPIGEVWDVPFAAFSAFVVELFFEWPALAAFAFWEELLPFTDIVPTATIGWLLVVVLGVRPRGDASLSTKLRGKVDRSLFASGALPPPADRRSFTPPEPYLREESRPWED